ncbi:MAG: hypothetical protein HN856_00995 [Gammaproteobacteria bacterium]|nr:hypothetical protein [Gammaproteobacteria bacterium]MCH1549984.1 hypothetical protein [Pseudomonadales bacterium]
MTTREETVVVLNAWINGSKDELAVWQWAEGAKADETISDMLVRDLVDTLAYLPFDMITTEDAAVMLDALANPVEETDLSINLLWNHIDGIATDARRFQLKDHSFYGQFCDGMD